MWISFRTTTYELNANYRLFTLLCVKFRSRNLFTDGYCPSG